MIAYGEPIEVPVQADRQVMEVKRLALQEALDRLADETEALARGDDRRGPAAGTRIGRPW